MVPAFVVESKFAARLIDSATQRVASSTVVAYSRSRVKDSSSATERVGRYQLLEPIGGGPNGMVARAKVFGVAGFERQFAVKRFAPELTIGTVAQQLSAAARSYGSLEHPRIARMSEFGVAQGQTFTAVEYVAGLDAFRLLQEAKLAGIAIAAGGALALVSQAARAVGYAHGRGLSHLGLCPTNVIVTVDGDVKVTDFGILAATMPSRPLDAPRLAHRIPYLAPEQLAGESTSAATDVFVLGVIAYELVTGQRAYRGDTPAVVAQAILAGPPAEPPLPRPIVRVLQRCLARSPFERFPDARALADALDAALRVAPVPGTRKDIGAQIKVTLDHYAALNEGNLSGMVALNLHGASLGSQQPLDAHDVSTQPFMRPEAKTDVTPVVPGAGATLTDVPKPFSTVAGLAPPPIPVPPGVTPPPHVPPAPSPAAPKTMLGIPPVKKAQVPGVIPPIGKPAGHAGPPAPPPASTTGAIPKPPAPTGGIPRPPQSRSTPPPLPAVRPPTEGEILEPSGLLELTDLTPPPAAGPMAAPAAATRESLTDMSGPTRVASVPGETSGPTRVASVPGETSGPTRVAPTPGDEASAPGPTRPPKPTPGQNFEGLTGEMSSSMLDELNKRSVKDTSEIESIRPALELDAAQASAAPAEDAAGPAEDAAAPVDRALDSLATEEPADPSERAQTVPRSTMIGVGPAVPSPAAPAAAAAPTRRAHPTTGSLVPGGTSIASRPKAPSRSKTPLVAAIALLVLGGAGVGGWYLVSKQREADNTTVATKPDTQPATKPETKIATGDKPETASTKQSATPPAAADAGVASAPIDAGSAAVATTTVDAGAVAAATSADPDADTPTTVKPSATSDKLVISSKPSGARVFIDGADQGTTPLKLAGSADRHTMVLLLPNHDLYVGEVDGHGVFDISLKAVTPTGGHAGIKVIKCKQKERYYVYVDGAPTGMTCPTERIDTVVGNHVVEVYDIVTDSRRKFDVYVKDERLSARVRIDD